MRTLSFLTVLAVLAPVLASAQAAQSAQPPASLAAACASPEHHQFDFWIGKWDVFDAGTGAPAGASLIEGVYGGCVLRENWSQPGFAGGSLNIYSAADGRWHQTWVDQAGARREFSGGLDSAGRMVMTTRLPNPGKPEEILLVRITWSKAPDGAVRQTSDYSKDDGTTWKPRYDYIYRPAHGG